MFSAACLQGFFLLLESHDVNKIVPICSFMLILCCLPKITVICNKISIIVEFFDIVLHQNS